MFSVWRPSESTPRNIIRTPRHDRAPPLVRAKAAVDDAVAQWTEALKRHRDRYGLDSQFRTLQATLFGSMGSGGICSKWYGRLPKAQMRELCLHAGAHMQRFSNAMLEEIKAEYYKLHCGTIMHIMLGRMLTKEEFGDWYGYEADEIISSRTANMLTSHKEIARQHLQQRKEVIYGHFDRMQAVQVARQARRARRSQ